MKFLNVNATIILKPVFEGDVLKAGTPLDISGAIANSDAAVGLVASDTAKGAESIAVVTEGTIDLTEVAASYGTALTDDCIAALKGITFLYGGKAVVPSGGSGLPDYSEASDGDVLAIENGAPAWKEPSGGGGALYVKMTVKSSTYSCDKTYSEISAAYAAGTPVIGYLLTLNSASAVTKYCIARELSVSESAASFYFIESLLITTNEDMYATVSRFGVGSGGGLVYEKDSITIYV